MSIVSVALALLFLTKLHCGASGNQKIKLKTIKLKTIKDQKKAQCSPIAPIDYRCPLSYLPNYWE